MKNVGKLKTEGESDGNVKRRMRNAQLCFQQSSRSIVQGCKSARLFPRTAADLCFRELCCL